MFGQVSHELEVNAPATRAWEIYGTLRLAEMVVEELPDIVQKIDVIEGDGGLGTVLRLSFKPGNEFPVPPTTVILILMKAHGLKLDLCFYIK